MARVPRPALSPSLSGPRDVSIEHFFYWRMNAHPCVNSLQVMLAS